MRQDSRHHVSAADPAQKRRQDARLLEHRGESASRRWPGGVAPGSVFGRDQFVASRGLTQGNRGVFDEASGEPRTLALFPEDRTAAVADDAAALRVCLSALTLRRPRQWGACWLAGLLWRELQLDRFWTERLLPSRKGTRWEQIL